MKKLVTMLAAMAFVASASAQVLLDQNFEDGTQGTWKIWTDKPAVIVGANKAANGSKHAIELFTGGYCDVKGVKAGSTYKVSADVNLLWADEPGYLKILGYSPKAKKLELVKSVALPTEKGYKNVSFEFKAKYGGYYRFAIEPTPNTGFKYAVDNMKVEQIK